MKFYLGLLVVSALFVAVTRARSSGRDEPVQELQTRNLDVVPVQGQYQKRQSAYYSDGSEQDMYGDVQVAKAVTDCVTSIAKTGIKRAFPKCKAYIKQVTEFCRSPNGKKTRAKDCKSVSVSIRIAIDECDVLAEKRSRKPAVTELCKTLVPPKKSKADCKPNQLFGQVLGGSTTPRCFDAPFNKRSKTRVLPIRMYRPLQWKNFAQLQSLTNSTQMQGHDPTTAYAQNPFERVVIKTLPIGQGDCTVIYCPTTPGKVRAILFDCGARGGTYLPIEYFQRHLVYYTYTDVNSKLVDIPVTSITVMISHGHADHYNRIPKLFDPNSEIGEYLIKIISEVIVGGPDSDYSATTISRWLTNIAKHKPVYFINGNKYHKLPDPPLPQLCPDPDNIVFEIATRTGPHDPKRKNERGMVMRLSCVPCGAQLLLPGDMEGDSADEMVEHNSALLSATHYKMAHHGAINHANKVDWLQAISPGEVHVSHRHNGGYRHPRCDAFYRIWSIEPDKFGTTDPIGSEGHPLDCFDTELNRVEYTKIYHRVFSTAPISGKLCAITLTFSSDKGAVTGYFCGGPDDFGGSSVDIIVPDDPGEDKEED